MNLYQITDWTGQVIHVASQSMANAIELFAQHSAVEPQAIEKQGTLIMTVGVQAEAVVNCQQHSNAIPTFEEMQTRMPELAKTAEGVSEIETWAFQYYRQAQEKAKEAEAALRLAEARHRKIQERVDKARGVEAKSEKADEVVG